MKTLAVSILLVTGLASCATAQTGNVYSGEVWTWDQRENTVTLRQAGGQTFRVKVTPDQLRTLRLHETATVRGELAAPAEIAQITVPTSGVRAVTRGPIEQSEVAGTVSAVDPQGTISVTSPRGTLRVWTAEPGQSRFAPGSAVRVWTSVQPVDMVPAVQAPVSATPETIAPAAMAATEPGEHAVVMGRVLAVDPAGTLTVESPRGPITVSVPDPSRYRAGGSVQVRTSVHPAR